jgi:hypothetical protein
MHTIQPDFFEEPIHRDRNEHKDAVPNITQNKKPMKARHQDRATHNKAILNIIEHEDTMNARHPYRAELREAILKIVQHEEPMKACQIARLLTLQFGEEIPRHDVNSILYSNNGLLNVVRVRPTDHRVVMRNAAQAKPQPRATAKPIRPKVAPTLIGVPTQPLAQPIPRATGGIVYDQNWKGRFLIRPAIGLGYAFLAFEVVKLLL